MKSSKFLGSGAVTVFDRCINLMEFVVNIFDFKPNILSATLYFLFIVSCIFIITVLPQPLQNFTYFIIISFSITFIGSSILVMFNGE